MIACEMICIGEHRRTKKKEWACVYIEARNTKINRILWFWYWLKTLFIVHRSWFLCFIFPVAVLFLGLVFFFCCCCCLLFKSELVKIVTWIGHMKIQSHKNFFFLPQTRQAYTDNWTHAFQNANRFVCRMTDFVWCLVINGDFTWHPRQTD